MGMFTTIVYAGHGYQIKTGFDECATYGVGDRIPWEPDERYPGSHIDGAHGSIGPDLEPGYWFIIKDCVICAVEPMAEDVDADVLCARYGIGKPPRSLWSAAAWKEKEDREAAFEEEWQRFKREHGGTEAGAIAAFYTRQKMRETSIIDRLLPARRVD